MTLTMQKKILHLKRLEKGLSVDSLGKYYNRLESGALDFGSTCLDITYPIIKALDLTMDDIEMILSE